MSCRMDTCEFWKIHDFTMRSFADSLLGISVDQGLVGEHEAPVGAQQEGVAHVGHRGRLGGPPETVKSTEVPVKQQWKCEKNIYKTP